MIQDLILVEGGSVAKAGSICWHTGGVTDSYRDGIDPFTDGLGLQ